jgi:hypothetical protein
MTSHITSPFLPQSETETAAHLFDNWFDGAGLLGSAIFPGTVQIGRQLAEWLDMLGNDGQSGGPADARPGEVI